MMAALWFENVAHEAITTPFVFRISEVKTPEDGNLPRISCHSLDERPHKQYEEHVKSN
jgi:hypothetical protein